MPQKFFLLLIIYKTVIRRGTVQDTKQNKCNQAKKYSAQNEKNHIVPPYDIHVYHSICQKLER